MEYSLLTALNSKGRVPCTTSLPHRFLQNNYEGVIKFCTILTVVHHVYMLNDSEVMPAVTSK
jgi:hypothetical protein